VLSASVIITEFSETGGLSKHKLSSNVAYSKYNDVDEDQTTTAATTFEALPPGSSLGAQPRPPL